MTNNSDNNSIQPVASSPATQMAAKTISFIFSPLLIPTYCTWTAMWSTTLSWLPANIRWMSVLYAFLFTCILPLGFISLMRISGHASDMSLRNRRQRFMPYIAGVMCYAAACFYFHRAYAPEWFYLFFAGAGLAVLISLLVSLKWKISAHAAAVGGWLAMLLRIMTGPYVTVDLASFAFPCTVIFAGAVCSSRLIIGAHTPLQLLAGLINGFVCVWLCTAVAPQY